MATKKLNVSGNKDRRVKPILVKKAVPPTAKSMRIERSPAMKRVRAEQATPVNESMIKKDRIPAGIPSFYADQIVDIVYGIHTSKLIFGFEGDTELRPVGMVIIPTAALLFAAAKVRENLSAPGMIEETGSRYAAVLQTMRGVSSAAAVGEKDDVPMSTKKTS